MPIQFISIPVMLILSVLQMTAISRITLLSGSADIILIAIAAWGIREKGSGVYVWALIGGLLISFASAVPFPAPLVPYLFTAFLARGIQSRLWQSPILSMIAVVAVGTIFQHLFSILILQFKGLEIGLMEGLRSVTMPSLRLNFLFLFPVFSLINDLARWILREEVYD